MYRGRSSDEVVSFQTKYKLSHFSVFAVSLVSAWLAKKLGDKKKKTEN